MSAGAGEADSSEREAAGLVGTAGCLARIRRQGAGQYVGLMTTVLDAHFSSA
jgi:hypothetical protein